MTRQALRVQGDWTRLDSGAAPITVLMNWHPEGG
jgi:hypothetical protein